MMASKIDEWAPSVSYPLVNMNLDLNADGTYTAVCVPTAPNNIIAQSMPEEEHHNSMAQNIAIAAL